ncbi:MAG TPA: peptidoglycan DD-metalloendopeptidase family protein [Patescibacteria group bacterium]|nr:peptidoglycan DD-metalloendopeptidase family protein [Patescibacteria group bacterium]
MKNIKRLIAVIMVCMFASSVAISADTTIDAWKKKLEETNKQLKQTQNAINQAQTQKKTISKQVEELDNKLNQAERELDAVEEQLGSLESQIVITKRDLERASQDADGQKDTLKKRVRVMYETGSVGYLAVILESTSFSDFISRMDFLKKIMNYDVTLLKNMKSHRDNIAQQEAQLQSELDEKERLKQQIGDKKEEVASAKDDREKVLNELVKDLKELNRLEDKLLEESKEFEKKIIAAQSKEKYAGGKIEWPVPSSTRITSPYGYRIHPILKTKKLHTGIDIGASSGKDVVAGNDGTVIFSGYYGGYGYTLIIDHGGQISTLYAHNSKLLVKEGDKVKRGQTISKIGSTGLSTGPHLHFEVRLNGKHTNPMTYLSK